MALPNWGYRRAITINNSNPNTLTDYQVLVVLDTASIISAGKMKSDGSDIRFTDSNGSTLLNYWIESGINTSSTKIWVKVPTIPASSTKTIYLYYGNPNATSQSSIANTFIREISGVVGAWSLDEGTGTTAYDSSGNNNTGTLYNGPTWTNGKFNKALSFDGVNDYVNVGNNPSLYQTPNNQWVICAWVYPTSISGSRDIVRKNTAGLSYLLRNGDGAIQSLFHYSDGSWSGGTWGTFTLNTWQFVVALYDGSTIRHYKDGVEVGSLVVNKTLSFETTNNVAIGRQSDGDGEYWSGLIDEVRIYNKALTQTEITDLYNNYGYSTTAYPGKVLVRKFSSPEPTTSVGAEMKNILLGASFLFNLV